MGSPLVSAIGQSAISMAILLHLPGSGESTFMEELGSLREGMFAFFMYFHKTPGKLARHLRLPLGSPTNWPQLTFANSSLIVPLQGLQPPKCLSSMTTAPPLLTLAPPSPQSEILSPLLPPCSS